MGQTVNLLAYAFGGSNPSLPTFVHNICKKRPVKWLLLVFYALCKYLYLVIAYKEACRLFSKIFLYFCINKSRSAIRGKLWKKALPVLTSHINRPLLLKEQND